MTNAVIVPLLPARLQPPPVRPPHGPARSLREAAVPRRGLSLPEPPITRTADTIYGMSALDRGGRIADRAVIEALDWAPGTTLRLDVAHTHLTQRAVPDGTLAVKDHRYLWLPATSRQRLGLRPGDRVLLAAEPKRRTLVVYPPGALDELLGHGRSASEGGGRDE